MIDKIPFNYVGKHPSLANIVDSDDIDVFSRITTDHLDKTSFDVLTLMVKICIENNIDLVPFFKFDIEEASENPENLYKKLQSNFDKYAKARIEVIESIGLEKFSKISKQIL